MEATLKMFVFLLLCCLCNGGSAEYCKLSDLVVTQEILPWKVNGYTEYTVAVENRCIYSQANIKVACRGFNSSMISSVDPDVIRPDGDGELCTLNGGRPVGMGYEHAVKFYYAWSTQFSFKPVSSTIASSSPAPAPASHGD